MAVVNATLRVRAMDEDTFEDLLDLLGEAAKRILVVERFETVEEPV